MSLYYYTCTSSESFNAWCESQDIWSFLSICFWVQIELNALKHEMACTSYFTSVTEQYQCILMRIWTKPDNLCQMGSFMWEQKCTPCEFHKCSSWSCKSTALLTNRKLLVLKVNFVENFTNLTSYTQGTVMKHWPAETSINAPIYGHYNYNYYIKICQWKKYSQ